jgi:DNA-directed RNA polymerase subunit beta'
MPTQDMIIGLFFLTREVDEADGLAGNGRVFSSTSEAIMAFDRGEITLQSKIRIRLENVMPPAETDAPEGWSRVSR